jgi:hypothetical protein
MKIFIAGCGRSGTTLIRDLMNCFQDTYVLVEEPYGEASFSRFTSLSRVENHVVIKRTGECWKTLPSLPIDVGLIYCVRHPFDVLTSTHPLTKHLRRFHITLMRWNSEYNALDTLRAAQPKRNIFILKYEDLVHDPNTIQEKIAGPFGLIRNYRFSENPAGIQIFADSIEKWKKDPDLYTYLQTIPHRYRLLIHNFCEEFEYTLPMNYSAAGLEIGEWSHLSLMFITNPNDLETVEGKPFFWMGGEATILHVKSPFTGNIQISFDAMPGPSYPKSAERHLRITSGNWNTMLIVQSGTVTLEAPVQIGENEITFEVIEKPTLPVMPNGDNRPLMLGVLDLKIEQ